MQNDNNKKRFAGKGYYIALIACLAAVGISGYVIVQTARNSALEASASATISPAPTPETGDAPSASQKPKATADSAAASDKMEDSYESTVAAEESETMQWPLEGQVLSSFSRDTLTYSQTMADWRTHEGLDIAAEADAPVMAAQSGTVTAVYEDDFLGSVVVVSHDDDCSTLYANLAKAPEVSVGDTVSAGDVIGRVGGTALLETKEPDHLHFEVFNAGTPVDPMDYLPSAS